MNKLTQEEQLIIMEAARIGLADAETFDWIADELDLDDNFLVKLREKLQNILNN